MLPRLVSVALLGLAALLATRDLASPDAGFHLALGEHILRERAIPQRDPLTFTRAQAPLVATSWGYEVLAALAHRLGGVPLLVLSHAGLVVLAFALAQARARGAAPAARAWALLLGVLGAETRFAVRPEVVSWVLLVVLLGILDRHLERRRRPGGSRVLAWLVPLEVLWVNLHALHALGLAVLLLVLLGDLAERRRLDGKLAAFGAAAALGSLLNPHGARGALFPLELLGHFGRASALRDGIVEFRSPLAILAGEDLAYLPALSLLAALTVLVASLAGALAAPRGARPRAVLLWLGLAPLGALMVRNLPLLGLALLPEAARGLEAGARRLALAGTPVASRRLARAALGLVLGASLVLGVLVVHDAYYIASRRGDRFGVGLNPRVLPVEAARFAVGAGLRGPVLNHLNFGGYLAWATGQRVFIDGRLEQMGEELARVYRGCLGSAAGLEACVDSRGIRWLVVPYRLAPGLVGHLSRDPRWRLGHVDGLAAVFARRGPQDTPQGPEPDPAPGPVPDLATLPGLGGPGRRSPVARWLADLGARRSYPDREAGLAIFHHDRGELELAAGRLARAIQASRGDYVELYANLGWVALEAGRFDLARACFQVVLGERPRDGRAREGLRRSIRPAADGGA